MEPAAPDEGASTGLSRRGYMTLLAASGVAVAGCLSTDDRTDPPGEPPEETPTATPEEPTAIPEPTPTPGPADVVQWHPLTLTFEGPETSETADLNPFLDYRLDVTFTGPDGTAHAVPGHYAADGDAAETDATSGSAWRVHFAPPTTGEWTYRASFVTGTDVAVAGGGTRTAFDGATGTFTVGPVDRPTEDLRTRGRLAYVGEHYLRFLGTGEYYLKTGANSPENFLAYHEFSGTEDTDGSFLHRYDPHVRDWRTGDPTWQGGKGKGIVGAINYLSRVGINAHYVLTYTVDRGDGGDVWPWTSPAEKRRFDVSKLDQWNIVFEHMTRRGLQIHLVLQETENDRAIDGGDLGVTRSLYVRELVARFAHHPALRWNLGEETTLSHGQLHSLARYLRGLDPYDHPITVHTRKYGSSQEPVYRPFLGKRVFEGPSLQSPYDANEEVVRWRTESAESGRAWVVTADELGDHMCGVPADGETCNGIDQERLRSESLWGTLLGGAGGVEWYFGYESVGGDLELEDYRTREQWWAYNRHARTFLEELPFWEMAPANEALAGVPGYGFAAPGSVYVFSLSAGGEATVTLEPGRYTGRWYDPRTGEFVGDSFGVEGGSPRELGSPPRAGHMVALLTDDLSYS